MKALKAVYSYFFPEVRLYLYEKFPDRLYLTQTLTKHLWHSLSKTFEPPLKLPWTGNGEVDLDSIHEPIIDRVVRAYKPLVPALGGFRWRYPTAGSSEGIFHILAALSAGTFYSETATGYGTINILEGEYEGYAEYADTLGMLRAEWTPREALRLEPDPDCRPPVWFISNPSARNGMIIDNEFINELCDKGHKVILDLAYAGMTKPYEFDVSHKNIAAVVMSLSKPYGVFRFRIGGFTFSREPINSLYANKWFKDVPALLTALRLVEEIPPGSMYYKYARMQRFIAGRIRATTGLPIRPSHVFLLAWMKGCSRKFLTPQQKRMVSKYKRGDGYRFCLTPYFEMMERRKVF